MCTVGAKRRGQTPHPQAVRKPKVQGRDEDSLQVADAPRVHDAGPAGTLSSVHTTLSSVHNTLFSVHNTLSSVHNT